MQEGVPSSRDQDSSDLVKAISTKQTSHAAAGDFVDSDSFIVANPRSLLELDKPPKSIPISETGSGPSALSLGSTPGSFRSSESDPATWTLPTLPWRDWELNLDDLRVRFNLNPLHNCMRASAVNSAGIQSQFGVLVSRSRPEMLRLPCCMLLSTPQLDRLRAIRCHAGLPE